MVLAGVVVAGIASWVAAPFVGMARRGTLDQQRIAAMRAEPARAPRTDAVANVPAPRAGDEPARESEPLSA